MKVLYSANKLEDIDLELIQSALNSHSFCIIRGLIDASELCSSLALLGEFIENNEDRACTGESSEEVKSYFMKLSIGLGNHSGNSINRARFMRTIYFPLNTSDDFMLVNSFKTLAKVRNLLMNKPIDFAVETPEDGLWTAARIHHFPTGGGHMVIHKDTLLPQYLTEMDESTKYFQPILIMSQKGIGFDKGGGVAMLDGSLVEYEDYTKIGDIVIYDVNTIHGVNEIDLHRPFLQRSRTGRYSGLVTLYKDFPS